VLSGGRLPLKLFTVEHVADLRSMNGEKWRAMNNGMLDQNSMLINGILFTSINVLTSFHLLHSSHSLFNQTN